MNHRLEQREKMLKKQQQELDKQDNRKNVTAEVAVDGGSHTDAEEERQRLMDYEEAFHRIKESTGVSDVNEVIQKFLTQEDTFENLQNLTRENQAKIEQLTEEKRRLRLQVEELKFSSGGNVGRRQVIDDFEAHLTEATEKFERNRGKYERMAKMLIAIKAGIDHLADKMSKVTLDNEAQIKMSDQEADREEDDDDFEEEMDEDVW